MRRITNPTEHEAALVRIQELFGSVPGTPEGDEFERLADLINDYEDLHYPMRRAKPEVVAELLGKQLERKS
jgi:HTH-type transcriptional regulator/antitoxin HigA